MGEYIYMNGYTIRETAKMLGVNKQAIEKRIKRRQGELITDEDIYFKANKWYLTSSGIEKIRTEKDRKTTYGILPQDTNNAISSMDARKQTKDNITDNEKEIGSVDIKTLYNDAKAALEARAKDYLELYTDAKNERDAVRSELEALKLTNKMLSGRINDLQKENQRLAEYCKDIYNKLEELQKDARLYTDASGKYHAIRKSKNVIKPQLLPALPPPTSSEEARIIIT